MRCTCFPHTKREWYVSTPTPLGRIIWLGYKYDLKEGDMYLTELGYRIYVVLCYLGILVNVCMDPLGRKTLWNEIKTAYLRVTSK